MLRHALLLLTLAPLGAHAKPAKAPAPVAITVENACAAEIKLSVGESTVTVAAGQKSAEQSLAGRADGSFPVKLEGASAGDLGLLGFESGQRYEVKVQDCRAGGADLVTQSLSEPPAGLSPLATAAIRFRARQNLSLEYKAGKTGRFMPLSVAMTRYVEVPTGDFEFTLRLRAAKNGPVMDTFSRELKLAPGKRYLIEASAADGRVLFKQEDEGYEKKGS